MPCICWFRALMEYSKSRMEEVLRLDIVLFTSCICRLVSLMSTFVRSISLSYCCMRVTTFCSLCRMRSSSASTSFSCEAREAYMVVFGSKSAICERSLPAVKLRSLRDACFRFDTVAVMRLASSSALRVAPFRASICSLTFESCASSLAKSEGSDAAFICPFRCLAAFSSCPRLALDRLSSVSLTLMVEFLNCFISRSAAFRSLARDAPKRESPAEKASCLAFFSRATLSSNSMSRFFASSELSLMTVVYTSCLAIIA